MIRVGVPVECQNGHKATWVIEISGLNPRHIGVGKEERCDCPKFDIGEGWRTCGDPFVMEETKGEEA